MIGIVMPQLLKYFSWWVMTCHGGVGGVSLGGGGGGGAGCEDDLIRRDRN